MSEEKGGNKMKEEILEILDEQINNMMEMINEENDKDLSQEMRSQLMFMKRQIEKQLNTNQ
jgi:gamma-glutamyl phosphate reductase